MNSPESTLNRKSGHPNSPPVAGVQPTEYARRRAALRERCGDAVIVLEGNIEGERGDPRSSFFQEPNFAYLTGWFESGALLLLAPAGSAGVPREILFLPQPDPTRALWTGPVTDPSEAGLAARLGVEHVAPRTRFEGILAELLASAGRIACLAGTELEKRLKQCFPFREIRGIAKDLAALRMVKSPAEVAILREAVRITAEGQRRGWRSLQSSASEYEVAADITHEFLRLGAERHAFAPIVASGPNACALHYSRNRAPLRPGTLAILDLGAEYLGYAGDLTRTVPIGGRFSERQRELYDAVLEVHRQIVRAVKPGAFLGREIPGGLHQQAVELFRQMRLGPKKEPLDRFFVHGISHHLGMDVHDPGDSAAPLAPGMVVTVEPGVYIAEEGIGIRIEDDVLVTEAGAEVLSAGLPREAAEVEAWLSS